MESLAYILGGANVWGIHVADLPTRSQEALDQVAQADVAFSFPLGEEFGPFHWKELSSTAKKLVAVPPVHFAGFHPDLTYLTDLLGRNVKSPLGDYHSIIILAGFLNGFPWNKIARLFNALVYSRLGYFDAYAVGREELLTEFRAWDFEIEPDIINWEARGCFMHTVTHPKNYALTAVAKVAATKAGFAVDQRVTYDDFYPDLFSYDTIYPVFPEIASRLGLTGHYVFKPPSRDITQSERVVYSLEDVITKSLEAYAAADASSWILPERLKRSAEVVSAFR